MEKNNLCHTQAAGSYQAPECQVVDVYPEATMLTLSASAEDMKEEQGHW